MFHLWSLSLRISERWGHACRRRSNSACFLTNTHLAFPCGTDTAAFLLASKSKNNSNVSIMLLYCTSSLDSLNNTLIAVFVNFPSWLLISTIILRPIEYKSRAQIALSLNVSPLWRLYTKLCRLTMLELFSHFCGSGVDLVNYLTLALITNCNPVNHLATIACSLSVKIKKEK